MSKYLGVIFDLDGTLLNTIDDITDGLNQAAKDLGIPMFTSDEAKYLVGSGVDVLITNSLTKKGYSQQLFPLFKEKYLYYYGNCKANKTKPYDGILELLKKLKEKNIKIAVFSNKPDNDTQDVINTYFGKNFFDVVVGKRNGVNIKPSSEGALPILNNFSLPLEKIIYIGDTKIDMETAKNIGVDSIGVLWGFRTREELLNNGAKYIACNPFETLKIIEGGKI